MKITGFSHTRIDSRENAMKAIDLLSNYFIPENSFIPTESEPARYSANIFIGDLTNQSLASFYEDEKLDFEIDNSRFSFPELPFPHSKTTITLPDTTSIADAIDLVCEFATEFDFALAFVAPDAENFQEYAISDIGIGVGLTKVHWINYLSKDFDALLRGSCPNAFHLVKTCPSGGTLLVATPNLKEYSSLEDVKIQSLRDEMGNKLFSTFSPTNRDATEGTSGWILSPKTIISAAKLLLSTRKSPSFVGQAIEVPNRYKKNR